MPAVPDDAVPFLTPPNALGLTRANFARMNEVELRERVIKPLLVAMEFRDVTLWHGGATEQGKDFVMWKPDEFGQPVWYAVVAKAGRISGSVSGSGGAGDVGSQVLQAFGSSFPHPTTSQPTRATKVIVMASGQIIPTAMTAIQSMLDSIPHVKNHTTFVGGDKLWELVEEYLPARVVTDQLARAGKV